MQPSQVVATTWYVPLLPLAYVLVCCVYDSVRRRANRRKPGAALTLRQAVPNALDLPLEPDESARTPTSHYVGSNVHMEEVNFVQWKSWGRVSGIRKTPWNVRRQAAGAALVVVALAGYAGLAIGCEKYQSPQKRMPLQECAGLLATAGGGLVALELYRRELDRSAYDIESRPKKYVLRELMMIGFWFLTAASTLWRLIASLWLYTTHWTINWATVDWSAPRWGPYDHTFTVLQLIVDFVCLLLSVWALWAFLKPLKVIENLRESVHRIFTRDEVPYLMPATTKQPSPESKVNVFQTLTFAWMDSIFSFKRRHETLTSDQIFAVADDERASIQYARFQICWKAIATRFVRGRSSHAAELVARPESNSSSPYEHYTSSDRNSSNTSIEEEGAPVVAEVPAKKKRDFTLVKVLWKFVRTQFCYAAFFKLANDSLALLDVQILNLLVSFIDSGTGSVKTGLFYVFLSGLNSITETMLVHRYFHIMFTIGIRIRSSLATAVYAKSLKVDQGQADEDRKIAAAHTRVPDAQKGEHKTAQDVAASSAPTIGQTINLMSTDAQRISDLMNYIQVVWFCPYQIIIVCIMLFKLLGAWTCLGGIAVMVALLAACLYLSRRNKTLQKKLMSLKDERLRITTEAIKNIRSIKLYSWEQYEFQVISNIRKAELNALFKCQVNNSLMRLVVNLTPVLVSLTSFAIYSGQGHELTPAVAFTALALFDKLRFPLFALPNVLMSLAESVVTVDRLQTYLNLPELEPRAFTPIAEGKPAVECDQLCLAFDDNTLCNNFSFQVYMGELVALVGRTGCGKSVLFNALLSEMSTAIRQGKFLLRGNIALCTQTAWIRSGTVRENILMGRPYHPGWYNRVVKACALEPDFKVLTDGDQTEIGERGVNLSGGQKQRIALARAVYFDADVYLLDDILSAVDTHVADHINRHVLQGLLKSKAILLATHRFECLGQASRIYMMEAGKRPIEFGGLAHAKSHPVFQALAQEQANAHEEEEVEEQLVTTDVASPTSSRYSQVSVDVVRNSSFKESSAVLDVTPVADEDAGESPGPSGSRISASSSKKPKTLVDKEMMQEGKVGGHVYKSYILAGGGFIILFFLLLTLVCTDGSSVGAGFWLSHWSDHAGKMTVKKGMGIYTMFQVIYILLFCVLLCLLVFISQRAARVYHQNMLNRILHAKISFFESTPIGRLSNKFSKDLYTVDADLPMTLYQFLWHLILTCGVLVAISIVLPVVLAVIAPVLIVYYFIERMYVAVARQVKRIDSVTRSPMFTHFSETLDGAKTIRAMRQNGQYLGLHLKWLDENMSAAYLFVASNRWLAVRLESLGTVLVIAVGIFAVLMRKHVSGGGSGLALSYVIQVTGLLNWLVRMSGSRESDIIAVERCIEYDTDDNCPQENYEEQRTPEEMQITDGRAELAIKPEQMGRIEFRDVFLRYRPDLPFALKGVSFVVEPGLKVGIVGRTGAGKSSLLVCLLRMVELAQGEILVHGLDINKYAVDKLRREVSVIPQDPVLFTGTIRTNLDPFTRFTDAALWAALEKACLKDYVEAMPDQLDAPVLEEGKNMSVGQRQLLCLARVLVDKAQILLLDEATSAVDPQTDAMIQDCLRREFESTSILTIAHRLKTVVDYDRIVVMENGLIRETGHPQTLLNDPNSEFYSMYYSAE